MKTIASFALLLFCGSLFAQKNFLERPYLETAAMADTLVIPNRIYMNIILNEGDSKGKKSVEELEKILEEKLITLNVDVRNDLTLATMSSEYERYFFGGQKINKSKMYSLLVRDAVTSSNVLLVLEQAGISNVIIARQEFTGKERLLELLKAKAIKKAKRNAQIMALENNKKVREVLFITDLYNSNNHQNFDGTIVLRGNSSLYGNRAPDAIPLVTDFQKIKFQVQVGVAFALE